MGNVGLKEVHNVAVGGLEGSTYEGLMEAHYKKGWISEAARRPIGKVKRLS